jgi:hypothetical protein
MISTRQRDNSIYGLPESEESAPIRIFCAMQFFSSPIQGQTVQCKLCDAEGIVYEEDETFELPFIGSGACFYGDPLIEVDGGVSPLCPHDTGGLAQEPHVFLSDVERPTEIVARFKFQRVEFHAANGSGKAIKAGLIDDDNFLLAQPQTGPNPEFFPIETTRHVTYD